MSSSRSVIFSTHHQISSLVDCQPLSLSSLACTRSDTLTVAPHLCAAIVIVQTSGVSSLQAPLCLLKATDSVVVSFSVGASLHIPPLLPSVPSIPFGTLHLLSVIYTLFKTLYIKYLPFLHLTFFASFNLTKAITNWWSLRMSAPLYTQVTSTDGPSRCLTSTYSFRLG